MGSKPEECEWIEFPKIPVPVRNVALDRQFGRVDRTERERIRFKSRIILQRVSLPHQLPDRTTCCVLPNTRSAAGRRAAAPRARTADLARMGFARFRTPASSRC